MTQHGKACLALDTHLPSPASGTENATTTIAPTTTSLSVAQRTDSNVSDRYEANEGSRSTAESEKERRPIGKKRALEHSRQAAALHKGADAIERLAEASAKRTKLAADLLKVEEERSMIELFSMPDTNPDLKRQFMQLSQLKAIAKLQRETQSNQTPPATLRLTQQATPSLAANLPSPVSRIPPDQSPYSVPLSAQQKIAPPSSNGESQISALPSSSNRPPVPHSQSNFSSARLLQYAGSTPYPFDNPPGSDTQTPNNDGCIDSILN